MRRNQGYVAQWKDKCKGEAHKSVKIFFITNSTAYGPV